MKKVYAIILSVLLVNVFALHAQRKRCFTDEVYHETIRQHPELLVKEQQLEEFTKNFIQQNNPAYRRTNPNGTSSVVYIIPIVFHIIHEYGPENISDAQVRDAVRILNRDYRKLNADTANIISDFISLAADIGVEFRLATIDSLGNCTNGIERIVSFHTHIGDDQAKFNPWPPNKYLNIWTVAQFGASHASAAAYAYQPGSVPPINPPPYGSVDGVIALANYVGSIGTSNVNNSRTLTHEIGHCFHLSHPWGNNNTAGSVCGDDFVSDTPITKGWDHCPNYPSVPIDICNAGIHENYQNYMDYSYCDCMFTYGQKARMIAALNSNIEGRNNLWSMSNLIATGTDGSTPPTCAPIADFYPKQDHICSGDSCQYISTSYNSDTMTYLWTFPNGTPGTSTLQNPYVSYTTPGPQNATLAVTNAGGSNSITKNSIISVASPTNPVPNYFDDFETAGTFPGNGYIINDAGNTWQRFTNAGYSGTSCVRILNYNQSQAGFVDSWITPGVDMTGCTGATLTFRMAYAQKDITKTDVLKIYISTNCGKSWGNYRRQIQGAQLATVPTVNSGFIPTSQSQWALITLGNITGLNGHSDARVKFEFTSGGDNNLYIDDINLAANCTIGVEEIKIASLNFDVYPNPANDAFNISFETMEPGKAEITISDLLGREIKTVMKDQLNGGNHEYNVDASQFSKGIYLVRLKAGDISTVKKLVIE